MWRRASHSPGLRGAWGGTWGEDAPRVRGGGRGWARLTGGAASRLAGLAGVVGVHVEAVRAAVEVGGADLDEFDEGGVEALAGGRVEADQGPEPLRGDLREVQPSRTCHVRVRRRHVINLW